MLYQESKGRSSAGTSAEAKTSAVRGHVVIMVNIVPLLKKTVQARKLAAERLCAITPIIASSSKI